MAYTIKDIASLAGVSIATASRILNGKPGVKPSTRQKVLDVARELDYLPNQLAKSMKTKRSNTIGLVVADITNPFYSDTAKTIEMRARENNYTVIVCNTNNSAAIQKSIITSLKERRIDGFIFASVELRDKPVRDLIREGYPCVMYHRRLEADVGDFIGCDNRMGIEIGFEHLYGLGHRRIGFISGPRVFSTGMERLKAFLQAAKQHGVPAEPYLIKEGGYDIGKTAREVDELLALPEPPTAIFAANDLMALQVLDRVLAAGYRVPEDISVMGFDDIQIASHHSIQLTTIDIQAKKCAHMVIETLLNRVEGVGRGKPQEVLLSPQLKVRRSTAPPGSPGPNATASSQRGQTPHQKAHQGGPQQGSRHYINASE